MTLRNFQCSIEDEEQISSLFQIAKDNLDKINEEANKGKKKIVKDTAKVLEQLIPIDTICIEIVTQLRGKVSERFIRECLDDKYKQQHRVENARKQKKQEEEDSINLAALTPLNQEEDTENKRIVITQDVQGRSSLEEENSNLPSTNDDVITDSDNAALVTKLDQQQGSEDQTKQDFRECSSCMKLQSENCRLQMALEEEKDGFLKFIFYLDSNDILSFVEEFGSEMENEDSRVLLSCTINKKTEDIEATLEGLDWQQNDSDGIGENQDE